MARLLFALLLFPAAAGSFMPDESIALLQRTVSEWTVGERIAFWAQQFVGTPYDPDPPGTYVSNRVIVSDEKVDCMYLVFRAVELALGKSPQDSLNIALEMRFTEKGTAEEGRVTSYDGRFRYGEEMIASGKWGREVTSEIGETDTLEGLKERGDVAALTLNAILRSLGRFENGDILFLINPPGRMTSGEVIGHLGIIKKEGEEVYLIHAAGRKNDGGSVRKVLLAEYAASMPFIGIRVTRLGAKEPPANKQP